MGWRFRSRGRGDEEAARIGRRGEEGGGGGRRVGRLVALLKGASYRLCSLSLCLDWQGGFTTGGGRVFEEQ